MILPCKVRRPFRDKKYRNDFNNLKQRKKKMRKCLKDTLHIASVLAAASVSASGTSASADVQDFGSLTFVVAVGATSGNDLSDTHKVAIKLLESNDNVTFTDVAGADIFDAEVAASDIAKNLDATGDASSAHLVHYRGNKRYVKVNLVETGTVVAPIAVIAIKGHGSANPSM
jgi:hypothetical protein